MDILINLVNLNIISTHLSYFGIKSIINNCLGKITWFECKYNGCSVILWLLKGRTEPIDPQRFDSDILEI